MKHFYFRFRFEIYVYIITYEPLHNDFVSAIVSKL